MTNREDKLDNLFREKFQDHEISPAEDYWPYLEKSLDKISFYKFGWKHINIYTISAGALLVALPLFYFLFPKQEENKIQPGQEIVDSIASPQSAIPDPEKPFTELPDKKAKGKKKPILEEAEKNPTTKEPNTKDSLPLSSNEEKKEAPVPEPIKATEEKPKPKKIIYVIQQDTIVLKDTVKVRRKRKD